MGQLTFLQSHYFKLVYNLLLLLISGNLVESQNPNCNFILTEGYLEEVVNPGVGEAKWIIYGEKISERTEPGTIIWEQATENIEASVASTNPYGKYLKGYKLPNRYRYVASDFFPDFTEVEQDTTMQRNVTFTCQDGEKIRVHFRFDLIDVNDPPEFTHWPQDILEVDLADLPQDKIINPEHPITLTEKDFDPENYKISLSSDRPELLDVEVEGSTDHGIGKQFNITLKLKYEPGEDKPVTGLYSLFIYAHDEQFTAKGPIKVRIVDTNPTP